MSPEPTPPRRIVVMMLGDVGDVLLATPALRRLRDAFPHAHVTALTKPATVAVLERSGLVDAFLPVDKHLFDRPTAVLKPSVALGLLRFVRALRRERFDAVILLHHLVTVWGTVKFAGLALAAGAPIRAGLDNGRGLFLTHRARDLGFDAAQEAEYWLRVVNVLAPSPPDPLSRGQGEGEAALEAASPPLPQGERGSLLWVGFSRNREVRRATPSERTFVCIGARRSRAPIQTKNLPSKERGAGSEGIIPTFVVSDAAQARADALLREAGVPPNQTLLAIHPGSGAYNVARRWFPDRFAAVADILAERRGLHVVLLGGADERALGDEVSAAMRATAANLAGFTSLDELGGVLRRCALLVGNDAGVAHMASAVGTPVVAVFGPSNHHTWHPLGRSLVVRAQPELPCMPCFNRGYSRGYPEGCPPRYCLQEVTPAMVVAAAERLLGRP